MKLTTIHPFPARMASEIAVNHLRALDQDALVADPMCGSGTVLRTCAEMGIRAFGCDIDPLAVLMSRVWTRPVATAKVEQFLSDFLGRYQSIAESSVHLPWIDECTTTSAFIDTWFEPQQKDVLRRLAWLLASSVGPSSDVIRVALSATIITKERGASIARDTSHSRPHRWFFNNDFDVLKGIQSQSRRIITRLASEKIQMKSIVKRCDSRKLALLEDEQVDLILTSPPYLNMIDYMRGHRLALVWLGYSIPELQKIRSSGIGSETKADNADKKIDKWLSLAVADLDLLSTRECGMLQRYAGDLLASVAEQARSLKRGGKLISVVGNSRLRGVYIENSTLLRLAATNAGLRMKSSHKRELPSHSRYLPISMTAQRSNALDKRMREEVVMTFVK